MMNPGRDRPIMKFRRAHQSRGRITPYGSTEELAPVEHAPLPVEGSELHEMKVLAPLDDSRIRAFTPLIAPYGLLASIVHSPRCRPHGRTRLSRSGTEV